MEQNGLRRRNGAAEEAAQTTDEPTKAAPGLHTVLQQRLRSVSQESEELLMYAAEPLSPTEKAQAEREKSQIPEGFAESQTIGAKVKGLHDDLEFWGYQNFPVITDHFNFLVYAVDLAVRSVRWFQFGFAACWLGFRLCLYAVMPLRQQ
ncbi:unnamed protein product [Effrenium voratum]|nr:unnamed protein product [Effrenium voratum]